MKPRDEIRDVGKPSVFAVGLEGRDVHHFRLPVYSDAHAVVSLALDSGWADSFVFAGAVIGLSWFSRGYDLETDVPSGRSDEELRAFSREVQRELQEAEYTQREVLALSVGIQEHLAKFLDELNPKKVAEVLENGEAAPQAATISS